MINAENEKERKNKMYEEKIVTLRKKLEKYNNFFK